MLILLNPPVPPGNNNKAGIYLWTHKESGKRYVGSASNLKTRLSQYFNINYLERNKTMYICNALKEHGYSTFSLSILKYIDITDLSLGEAKILILEREQFFLDLIFSEDKPNTYNTLKLAGSLLGFTHSSETKALISKTQKSIDRSGDNYPRGMSGKTHSAEALAILKFIDISNLDKEETRKIILGQEQYYLDLVFLGEDKPNSYNLLPIAGSLLDYKHTEQSLVKFSGENHHMFEKNKGENPFFGRTHSEETLAKMRVARGTTIYVYSIDKSTLVNTFSSAREAAEYFNCRHKTIMKYVKNELIFQNQWILSIFEDLSASSKGTSDND